MRMANVQPKPKYLRLSRLIEVCWKAHDAHAEVRNQASDQTVEYQRTDA